MAESPFPQGPPVATFFVARSPLFPLDDWLALGDGLEAPSALGDGKFLEEALAKDWRSIRAKLEALLVRPETREALFLASPDLVGRFEQVGAPEDGSRVQLALARYVFRMCGRPTPFGLFAGLTLGTVGAETCLEFSPRSSYTRHARLDNDYLFGLVDRLERMPEVAASLRFEPNSSLYKAAGSLRYAETRIAGAHRSNHLVAVGASDYLEETLARARGGADAAELAGAITAADAEVSREEADSFVAELIENKILVSDLAPAVTGSEPLEDLLRRLPDVPGAAPVRARLEELRGALDDLVRAPLGIAREKYVDAARRLETLPAEVELSRFLQVDLVKPGIAATLGPEPIAEIVRGMELLWRMAPGPAGSAIGRFAGAFFERYEGREVPLVEALDEDLGVEFRLQGRAPGGVAPLLEGLDVRPAPEDSSPWTRRDAFLYGKVVDALAGARDEITLETAELERVQRRDLAPLPAAFAVMAAIGARSPEAVARGEFEVVLQFAAGPSGANWLGRFCHAILDLRERVADHVRAEERHRPDAVHAEIVHLPEGRIGNILARPLLREYEIPYLGRSAAPAARQIPVTDLTLSFENGRLVLRSRRLGREVVPRLTSAHNTPASGLPIYRFLAALQTQQTTPVVGWDWGPLGSAPMLPRVRSGRVVLAPAQWRLLRAETERLSEAQGAARYRRLQEWRASRRVPRFVLLSEADNRLPLDLDNVLAAEVLVDRAAHAAGMVLHELIPGPGALLARGPEGRFVHEIIVPFVQPAPAAAAPASVRTARREIARTFPPGSEWLYAKLYTSEGSADRVLRDVVGPLRRMALDRGIADSWFFVRYADPHRHVRVRFHGEPDRLAGALVPALHALVDRFLHDGTVWRVQLDTYERETERYGGAEGVVLSERLFLEDSESVLELVEQLPGDGGVRARGSLALAGIHRLFESFGLELPARRLVLGGLRDGMARDINADKLLHVKLGAKFRANRRDFERIIDGGAGEDEELRRGVDILTERSERMAPVVAELTALSKAGRLTAGLPTLVASYIHMFVNRLLRSQHRRQEYVLYDFLNRIYDSRQARLVPASQALRT
jgi:thiopeptide-type bacteriocin biosynthesis protein